jgi:hypothetical protein
MQGLFGMSEQNQPKDFDAVLGGESPLSVDAAVLGGIEGIKRYLSSPVAKVRVAVLSETLKYGDAGLDLLIQALQDESKVVKRSAYQLLRKRVEPQVKQALQAYTPWNLVERLEEYPGYKGMHAEKFANRQVVEYNPEIGITNTADTAYVIRCDYDDEEDAVIRLERFLEDAKVGELEALVFGQWYSEMSDDDSSRIIEALVAAKNKLTSLKSIFIGDISSEDCEISWIRQSDVSPILQAYPQLEILQVRGGDGLVFSPPIRHNNLNALIIETGGLSKDTVAQIFNMNLPALEHLELWFGSEDYGGNCWVEDLNPILFAEKFANLTYLGLRNSQFSDEIATTMVDSPIINSISVLDLSMGTLSDVGAEKLLNCSAVENLDILNLSDNFISEEMVDRLCDRLSKSDVRVLVDRQEKENDDSYIHGRYCTVTE